MNYSETLSGRKMYYLDPKPEAVYLGDIITGLSNICRFTGQIPNFYSVAEHCVLGLNFFNESDPNIQRAWLLHDAAEAYMSDLPSPLKRDIPQFRDIEKGIMDVIHKKYDIEINDDVIKAVKNHDLRMLKTEASLLQKNVNTWGLDDIEIIPDLELEYWSPGAAERELIIAVTELFPYGFTR